MSTLIAHQFIARSTSSLTLLEQWRRDQKQAMTATAVEELCQEFIESLDLLIAAWPIIDDLYFQGGYPLNTGRELVAAIDATVAAVDNLRSDAAQVINAGHVLHGFNELVGRLDRARAIQQRATDYWPTPESRLAGIDAAREDFLRGDYVELSELIENPDRFFS